MGLNSRQHDLYNIGKASRSMKNSMHIGLVSAKRLRTWGKGNQRKVFGSCLKPNGVLFVLIELE